MTEIRFYHLEHQSLDQVLPALLTKALEQGKRVVIKAINEKEVERLNDHLWTYHPDSFMPHGSKKDGYETDQPVWLTTSDENPNGASVLILTQGTESNMHSAYSLCCEMLDGHDTETVTQARTRWQTYKDSGHTVTYWQQGDKGWEKKTG